VIQPGDIVRHKKDKALVRGIVRKISNSGLRAKVFWPGEDNPILYCNWSGYYRLDSLEKVEN
jgi:hypothetical protein